MEFQYTDTMEIKIKMSENHLLQKRTPEKNMFSEIEGHRGAKHIRENEFLNLVEPDLPNEHIAYDKIIVQ